MSTKSFQDANFKCVNYFASGAHKNTFFVCNKHAVTATSTLHLMQGCEQVHSQLSK